MDKRLTPARSSGGLSCSRAARPRACGGRSIWHRASPSTPRPSMTTSRQRYAGWPGGLALPPYSVWPRTRRCDRAVSLDDIAEYPVLADLTELPHREHAPNC